MGSTAPRGLEYALDSPVAVSVTVRLTPEEEWGVDSGILTVLGLN